MPLIWLPWARQAAPCAAPAARRSGWRGRRMRSRGRAGTRDGGGRPGRPNADAAAEWEAHGARGRRTDGYPRGRQPLDLGRLAGGRRRRGLREATGQSIGTIHDADAHAARRRSWLRRLFGRRTARRSGKPPVSLPTACAAMGALVLALMIWRVDVVRLLPQTAAFYKMVGLDVNLRGLVVQGRQGHHRDRRRQAGAGDRGRHHRRNPQAGRIAAAALFAFATRRAPRSMPGTRCWTSRC